MGPGLRRVLDSPARRSQSRPAGFRATRVNPGNKTGRPVFVLVRFRAHEQGIPVMTEIGRRIVRSGAYALLATAFVLACSLLLPAEEAATRSAMWSDPMQLPSSGSGDSDAPDPGAGQ